MKNFGKNSKKQLDTCHSDLQKIFILTLKWSKVDFGISEGNRPVERQFQLFLEGKSKIDGKTKKGKHNYMPSLAGDIYAYHPNTELRRRMAYDKVHLAYIAGVIDAVVEHLLEKGEITHRIRWGANWDNDGVIDMDQHFDDYPHFELIKI